jgi:hypothetical protein
VVTGAYLLLALGGILYLCGWVMLLVLGFKKSLGWGLVILFLSWLIVPLVVFLIKYWDEARLGFFVMVAGMLASGVGGFILVGSVATSAMAEFESFDRPKPEIVEPMPVEPYPDIAPEPTGIELEPQDELDEDEPSETDQVEDVPEDERPPPMGAVLGERVEWQPLDTLSNLPAYEGELIELHMKDGTVLTVTLDDIRGGTLQVTQRVGGGAMTYNVQLDMVEQVKVVK